MSIMMAMAVFMVVFIMDMDIKLSNRQLV